MIQRRSGAGFLLESAGDIYDFPHLSRENLDGDLSAKPSVSGSIHFSHPTSTEWRVDLVGAQTGASQQIHIELRIFSPPKRLLRQFPLR
jgi:hypothetical protein